MLDKKQRYLQIALNSDLYSAYSLLSSIQRNNRILVEAGTPLIKREGMRAVSELSRYSDYVVADLKIADGALAEVDMAYHAGASAITALGMAPIETLNLFIERCDKYGIDSMIDMLNVAEPMQVLRQLKKQPQVVILHKGRDEEHTAGKSIPYKQVNKIKSKYDVMISAAGGVDLKEARSAIFNGSNIVVVNIVSPTDPWTGIKTNENIREIAQQFLKTIE